jgi:hypothetical protein
MRKVFTTFFLILLLVTQVYSFIYPSTVFAAGQCGTDLYQGQKTGCYAVQFGGKTVPTDSQNPKFWQCGFGQQCYYFDRSRGRCGVDFYTDRGGTQKLTFCSISTINRQQAIGYDGCTGGEFCIIGDEIGSKECNFNLEAGGKLSFCFGGFSSSDEIRQSKVNFKCEDNCGGAGVIGSGGNIKNLFSRSSGDSISLTNIQTARGSNGEYSCVFMDGFDNSIKEAISARTGAGTTGCKIVGVGAAVIAAPAVIGVGLTVGTIGAAAGAAAAVTGVAVEYATAQGTSDFCSNIFSNYHPTLSGSVITADGKVACRRNLVVGLNSKDQVKVDNLKPGSTKFDLCSQIPDDNLKVKCQSCKGIWSAVGCIPVRDSNENGQGIIKAIVQIGLGVTGGVAILMIIIAGFMISTAQGDVKKAGAGKDLITSAVVGLLFVIFSVTILKFIGVTILQIPGFGQ